jgi:hypothetical protein
MTPEKTQQKALKWLDEVAVCIFHSKKLLVNKLFPCGSKSRKK